MSYEHLKDTQLTKKTSNAPEQLDSDDVAEAQFDFECSRTWDTLAPTSESSVRHCDGCEKPVYLSRNLKEARENARLGRCISLPMAKVHPPLPWWRTWETDVTSIALDLFVPLKRLFRACPPAPPPAPRLAPPEPRPVVAASKTGMFTLPDYSQDPPVVGWLVPLHGAQQGQTFHLEREVTVIGSDVTAGVRINAPGIEYEHCRIIKTSTGFDLYDSGSQIGTMVDGQPAVTAKRLQDGQIIAIADAQLAFKCVP